MFMGVLERVSNLFEIGHDRCQIQTCSFGMTLAKRAIGGVFHDEKRNVILSDAEIEHAHDVGVQESYNAGFIDETFNISLLCEPHLEHLDGGDASITDVLAEKYVPETALP